MILIKLYGKQRTGTNIARALIETNFADTCVLVNFLGWKHGYVEPYKLWIDNHTRMSNNGAIVLECDGKKTKLTPFDLKRALLTNEMRYIITIRNPFAFIVGIFNHWQRLNGIDYFEDEGDGGAAVIGRIVEQCYDYNIKYFEWMRIHRDNPDKSAIIRHEDVLWDCNGVMKTLERRLALPVRLPVIKQGKDWNYHSGAAEAVDDSRAPLISKTGFNRDGYRVDHYMEQLTPQMIRAIEDSIDWDLLRQYGYGRSTRYANWKDQHR